MSQVSDYDIANASGAAVRSDINLVFDAIKTLNSGSGDPTGAVAFMLYGDTSDNILKVRNSANSSFTEIGSINEANLGLLPINGNTAMTGGLQLRTTGSATDLPVKFSSDTDTGFGRFASNTLNFVCGGTEKLTLTATTLELGDNVDLKLKNGSVAIKFEYEGSGNLNFALPVADGANGSVLQTNGSGTLSFVAIQGVPTGTIFCFAVASVPTGYLECNGQSTTGFTALAALVGATVPDLRGEFVRGWASNTTDSTRDQGRQIGQGQSDDITSHTHTASGTASDHRHTYAFGQGSDAAIGANFGGSGIASVNSSGGQIAGLEQSGSPDGQHFKGFTAQTGGTTNSGGTVPLTVTNSPTGGTETRPRNVALMYIIKT